MLNALSFKVNRAARMGGIWGKRGAQLLGGTMAVHPTEAVGSYLFQTKKCFSSVACFIMKSSSHENGTSLFFFIFV